MLFDLTFPRLTLEKKDTAISPTQKLTKARGLAPSMLQLLALILSFLPARVCILSPSIGIEFRDSF